MELELAGPAVDDIRLGGTYKTGDLRLLLFTLEAHFPSWPSAPDRMSAPTQTPKNMVQPLIEARQRHPSWGAKKLSACFPGAIPMGLGVPAPPSATSSIATARSGSPNAPLMTRSDIADGTFVLWPGAATDLANPQGLAMAVRYLRLVGGHALSAAFTVDADYKACCFCFDAFPTWCLSTARSAHDP